MSELRSRTLLASTLVAALSSVALAQPENVPATADQHDHVQSAQPEELPDPGEFYSPALPDSMTLDEVLDRAGSPPPASYPAVVSDDATYAFTLIELLEYRAQNEGSDPLGWSAQGWIGRDFNKFWWKSEGEAVFEGQDEGESQNDLLYSRLISPFWNLQVGARYSNEWSTEGYGDTWWGEVGLQGLAPYMFELDTSFLLSEHGDLAFELEAEYSIRITQRLVLQPRTELALYAQDIPESYIGAGLSNVSLDLRLRYEIKRELAPYLGIRFQWLLGETGDLAEAAGVNSSPMYLLVGVRLAF